jgi:low affinity Fe/Cu permease
MKSAYEQACEGAQLGVQVSSNPFIVTFYFLVVLPTTYFGFGVDLANFQLSLITAIVAFLILIADQSGKQEDEKRDKAMHLKLDELIHAQGGARDELAGIEEKS